MLRIWLLVNNLSSFCTPLSQISSVTPSEGLTIAAQKWITLNHFLLSGGSMKEKIGFGSESVIMCWKVTEVDLVISPCRSDIINPYFLINVGSAIPRELHIIQVYIIYRLCALQKILLEITNISSKGPTGFLAHFRKLNCLYKRN